VSAAELAAEHEKELQPLEVLIQKGLAAAAGATGVVPVGVVTAPPAAAPDAPAGSAHLNPVPGVTPPDGTAPLGQLTEQVGPKQPAASNTDSPSRGVPKPILDPGKQITGGWGHGAVGPAQYFALDGSELRTLIQTLWRDIEDRMSKDLRFMMAICYPRVMARVTVEVCGATPDAAINDVAFTLESRILDLMAMAVDDHETPADALRDQAGLTKPFKHLVQTSTGTIMVDIDNDLSSQ
jgi:hypothetical protein